MASYETYRKQYLRSNDESMKKDIADSDAIYDNQAKTTKEKYGAQIDLAGQEYDDLERTNEVQKYINMREVAENNANLGLTDSGLNRTQSTAVQLSASNNAAKIQRDRTNMVNTLTAEMNAYLTEIENNKISSAASIRKGYESAADEWAGKAYQADVDAAAKASEARISAKNSLFEKLTNDEISDANKQAYIKNFVSDYGYSDELEKVLNNTGFKLFNGTTYDDAIQEMKSLGVSSDIYVGLMTVGDWKRRKGSYTDNKDGIGSKEVTEYENYKDYLADYVTYAIQKTYMNGN